MRAAQEAVDRARHEIVREAALQILHDQRQALVFADWSVYLMIGYEQSTLHRDKSWLDWIAGELLECLDSGRFARIAQHI